MESLKYAENKLGKKMDTPKALPKEHAFAPLKYDVEESNPIKKDAGDAYLKDLMAPADNEHV